MMKTRLLIYVVMGLGIVASLSSCRNDADAPITPAEGQALVIRPSVARMTQETATFRSGGTNSFFQAGDQIDVKITSSRVGATETTYTYTYGNGTFTGEFLFTPDQTYIKTLKAIWPTENGKGRQQLITDQRIYQDYRQANRMEAHGNTNNIMPTVDALPLQFYHEESSMTFRLAGQNANGLIIKSLLLELKDIRPGGLGEKGFWAYCGDGSEEAEEEGKGALNAKLILPKGIQFGPNKTGGGRMRIGLVTVGSAGTPSNDYRGIIYIPNSTNIILKENTDYLVTLTPEGYDLFATISIESFPQDEGRVAVPYQLPNKVNEGEYEINTIAQLITISWLLSGETVSPLWDTTTDWGGSTFAITNDIKVSDKLKAEGFLKDGILKTNKVLFSGKEKAVFADGASVFGND